MSLITDDATGIFLLLIATVALRFRVILWIFGFSMDLFGFATKHICMYTHTHTQISICVFACENDKHAWRCRQLAQTDLGTLFCKCKYVNMGKTTKRKPESEF